MWAWFIQLCTRQNAYERKSSTVRYAFPVIAATAVFAGLAAVTSQETSYISISTDPTSVIEGETVTITVRAFAHVPVNAVDIKLAYPKGQMVIEGIDTGTSVITLWTEDPYAKDGNVYLRGGVFQRGFLGEHTIASIRARATESGLAYVTVDDVALIAGDGKGTEVRVTEGEKNETRIYVQNAEDGKLKGEAGVAIVTDLDGNGSVDLGDISSFMSAWFTKGKTFDFNNDGKMTFKDFSILLADSFFK